MLSLVKSGENDENVKSLGGWKQWQTQQQNRQQTNFDHKSSLKP